jgi:hypothetical protein
MSNVITIGKRLIPAEQIALVEPYEPGANSRIQTDRNFLARVVLINRDSVLIEQPAQAFAEANGFRRLELDNVATNPAVRFQVESFEPTEGFRPSKPFETRLLWRDLDGNQQSKLLLTDPQTVLAAILAEPGGAEAERQRKPRRAPRRKARATASGPATHP